MLQLTARLHQSRPPINQITRTQHILNSPAHNRVTIIAAVDVHVGALPDPRFLSLFVGLVRFEGEVERAASFFRRDDGFAGRGACVLVDVGDVTARLAEVAVVLRLYVHHRRVMLLGAVDHLLHLTLAVLAVAGWRRLRLWLVEVGSWPGHYRDLLVVGEVERLLLVRLTLILRELLLLNVGQRIKSRLTFIGTYITVFHD